MSANDPFEQLRDILGEIRAEHGGESAFEEELRAARRGTTAAHLAERRRKIETLIEQGATEGERAAARAAIERIDAEEAREIEERMQQDLRDEEEFEEAAAFGEA